MAPSRAKEEDSLHIQDLKPLLGLAALMGATGTWPMEVTFRVYYRPVEPEAPLPSKSSAKLPASPAPDKLRPAPPRSVSPLSGPSAST